jgi:radical SAM superfamily enzyme YgiQ (UPF0313 family)
MGIQGEGEIAFPMLLDRIHKGLDLSGLPGLYLRGLGLQGERLFEENLDMLPLPNPYLWSSSSDNREYWIPIQTRRGCPMGCSYCSTAVIEGRSVRKRRPGLVIEESYAMSPLVIACSIFLIILSIFLCAMPRKFAGKLLRVT